MPSHEILGGLVQIYRRGGRVWHCSTCLKGRQYRVSTKETGLEQAKAFAEDWVLGLRGKSAAGILKTETTFAEAAKKFEQEYAAITEGERSPKWVEGHSIRLRLHLVPFFGKMGVSESMPVRFRITACIALRPPRRGGHRRAAPCMTRWARSGRS